MKTRIIFFGTPHFVLPVLDTLFDKFDLVGVVTAPDAPVGRGELLTPSPVKKRAQELSSDIQIFTPKKLDDTFVQMLKTCNAELFVTAAYGKIIPSSVLSLPLYGSLNIHPSLLPQLRGPSPIQSALLEGISQSGITIIKMDEKMDHGPIVAQWEYTFHDEDTFKSLQDKMFLSAAEKIPQVIEDLLAQKITPFDQNEDLATYCQMITKHNGFIDLSSPPEKQTLKRMIRAYYPWPGVYTKIRTTQGEKILKLLPDNKVQVEGKNIVSVSDFFNGYPELKPELEGLLLE